MSLGTAIWKRTWAKRITLIGAVLAVVISLLVATTKMYTVAGSSMMPALIVGDRVVVSMMAYDLRIPFTSRLVMRWSAPRVGDIVLFSVPNRETGFIAFKRVVAVPGDTVELRDDKLIINGQVATYAPLDSANFKALPSDDLPERHFETEMIGNQSRTIILTSVNRLPRSFGPVIVPADHYYLLGDYRDNSNDSRIFGPLSRDYIQGRLVMKAF